jgi:hypothetical protein
MGALSMSTERVTVAELVEGDVLLDTGSVPLNGGMGATVRAVELSRFESSRSLRVTCSHGYVLNLPQNQQVTVRR